MCDLVKYWAEFDPQKKPFVHPKDYNVLATTCAGDLSKADENFDNFIRSKSFGKNERRFHFSLYPEPYAGDLGKADIFILLLNPGFSPLDYYAHNNSTEFRQAQERKYRQEFSGIDYPNFYFDPHFCWTGAYQWWEKKFRDIAQKRATDSVHGGCYISALQELSRRVASIELVPYPSQSFGGGKLIESLPSAIAAQKYVNEKLVPRAVNGEIKLVVTRQVKAWKIEAESENIVQYRAGQARGASLSSLTCGGKLILNQLRTSN